MKNKLISIILVILNIFSLLNISYVEAEDEELYTTLRSIDIWTFNEYRYRITEQFFILRDNFDINWNIWKNTSGRILDLAKKWYNYLPDNLNNKNLLSKLETAIKRWIRYPENESNYSAIVQATKNYIYDVNIKSVTWTIEVTPKSWNAPLTVTLRWKVKDPSWTSIPNYNYTWWIDNGGKKKVIWDKISISYTFKEEWKFSVFLDVKSNHKNKKWYTDVLPFSSRANIEVKEKVASLIIKVNSDNLRQKEVLKFTPEEARYGLVFDATSSTPTSWGKFIKTEWDFWNGVKRENTWDPKIERVSYAWEWEFTVKLTLKTNELKTVERKFIISIHNPIATINSNLDEWFLWDKFTFSAKPTWDDDNLTYSWEIVDIDRDKIIFRKSWSLFTYSFKDKWKYNLRLRITEPSWEEDLDTKIIYINSRAPVADFTYSIPNKSKPNEVFLDATKSYDPDFSDDGKLEYDWIIDWERMNLEKPNFNGSSWYYTFDSIWEHSVVLEVTDQDNISNQKKEKVDVDSILSVEFFAFPRVIQREWYVKFVADSQEARFYEWDFWDGTIKWWKDEKITHNYDKSGIFEVKLKVRDSDDNDNTFRKNIYVWESDRPFAFISVEWWSSNSNSSEVVFRRNECSWNGAYIANRVDSIRLSAGESINIDWDPSNLTYSWKIWNDKYFTSRDLSYKFDEIGCFPVKLTVKSNDNGKTSSTTSWVKVENLKPTLSSLEIKVVNIETDPVIVNVSAAWAKDKDGVVQSYLWYYYTDIDPEPQDFRSTNWPSTTFVLPKVTWDYYFVVVMKDNNEDRITSEEVTWWRNSITLVWDNVNTPLVDLRVNDSSVSVWDEVVFTTTVKNILGQDISKKVSYSWDVDGDWFYDKQTKTSTFSHVFTKSGEFHPKVKVKYKWFSNTKNLTVNVANKLIADFDYISIWNKFIFLNKSSWKVDKIFWDMWDGNKLEKKWGFTYEYKDKKPSHRVELKISEWTKVKKLSKKVVKNIKNTLKAKKPWLNIFSSPGVSEEGNINLLKSTDEVFIYIGSSNWDFKYYAVDYDLDFDSDLNGWKDDDTDNKSNSSYTSGEPIKIKLNDKKTQKIRVSLIDEDWSTVESSDLNIIKSYIKAEEIDVDSISFNWVSNSEKVKIEKLKEMIKVLPQEHRLKAMMYVQKLQEEWFDETEKTRVIIEFEVFIDWTNYSNSDGIIDLLESLLVEWQEDKSEKNITYNALKTLIPTSINCDFPEGFSDCYSSLIANLDEIRDSNDIEKNKQIWWELLSVIKDTTDMTNKQKLDFKAILQTFVYGWVENIPEQTKQEVEEDVESSWSSNFFSLLKKIGFWLLVIILIFVWIIVLYWLYYKLTNKDDNIGFQEFIIDRTSSNSKNADLNKTDDKSKKEDDILETITDQKEEKEKVIDPLEKNTTKEVAVEEVYKKHDTFVSNDNDSTTKDSKKLESQNTEKWSVPAWLDWATSSVNSTITKNSKKEPNLLYSKDEKKVSVEDKSKWNESKEDLDEITKIEENKIPDWLKWSISKDKNSSNKETGLKEKTINNKEANNSIKYEENTNQKNTTEKSKKVSSSIINQEGTSKESKLSDSKVENKVESSNVPDWLKGSLNEDNNISKLSSGWPVDKTNSKEINNKENTVEEPTVEESKSSVSKLEDKKDSKNEEVKKTKADSKLEDVKIPDWLNTSFSSDIKEDIVQEDTTDKINVKETKGKEISTEVLEKDVNDKKVSKKEGAKKPKLTSFKKNPQKEKTKDSQTETDNEKKEAPKKAPAKTKAKKTVSRAKKETTSSDKKTKKDELWDDGMKVPDWLKTWDEDDSKK